MDNNSGVEPRRSTCAQETRAQGSASARLPGRLDAIYRDHAAFVWRVLRRYGIDATTAEDLVHEVFLVVHRRLADFDGRSEMRSWLYGIARGVASNHRRGKTREQRRLRLVSQAIGEPLDPEASTKARQAADLVEGFLAELDDGKRAVFELSELEGLRGPEIAEMLELNVDTVYSRLRVARRRFAERIERAQGGAP